MAYEKTNWQNSPSTNTPLNADNLNHIEQGIADAHDMIEQAEGKFDGDINNLKNVYKPFLNSYNLNFPGVEEYIDNTEYSITQGKKVLYDGNIIDDVHYNILTINLDERYIYKFTANPGGSYDQIRFMQIIDSDQNVVSYCKGAQIGDDTKYINNITGYCKICYRNYYSYSLKKYSTYINDITAETKSLNGALKRSTIKKELVSSNAMLNTSNGIVQTICNNSSAKIYVVGKNFANRKLGNTNTPLKVFMPAGTFIIWVDESTVISSNWYFRLRDINNNIILIRNTDFLPGWSFSTSSGWYYGSSGSTYISFTLNAPYYVEVGIANMTDEVTCQIESGNSKTSYEKYNGFCFENTGECIINSDIVHVYTDTGDVVNITYCINAETVSNMYVARASQAKSLRPELISNFTFGTANTEEKVKQLLIATYECGYEGIALNVEYTTTDNGETIEPYYENSVELAKYAYSEALKIGLKIKAIKTHYLYAKNNYDTMDFSVWFPVYCDACRDLYEMNAEYFTILNEFPNEFFTNSNYRSSINTFLGELKSEGYKTGFTGVVTDFDNYTNCDSINFHVYPSLTTKAREATLDDCIESFKSANIMNIMCKMRLNYPQKEFNITESGCQRVWEALALPEKSSWSETDRYDKVNGKPQAMFLDALLTVMNGEDIASIWTYYDDTAVITPRPMEVLKKWTGGRIYVNES